MRIVLVGASGTIGKAVDAELSSRHEVVRVNRNSGDFQVDISDSRSIENLFLRIGPFDALVNTAGNVHFGPFEKFTAEQFEVGLRDKLMGLKNIRAGGSFTLTSGLLNDDPIPDGVSAAMVNGALEGFVHGVAIVLPRNLRINVVSPTVVVESLPTYAPYFRGTKAIPVNEAALGYAKSVEGAQTGRVYRIGWSRDH